ncbi:MAG TPA: histidine kinase [Bacteroidales bacterium]|nr:histidine kinase [Bacteroidales bacterium]
MKHPVLEKRSRVIIWWLAWLLMAAGQSLLIFFAYGSSPGVAAADGLISMVSLGALGLAIWFPLRYMQKGSNQFLIASSNLLVTGIITIVFWILANRLLLRSIVTDKEAYELFWGSTVVLRIASGVLLYSMIILTYYLFISASRLAEKAASQSKLESLVREAELKMLRSQINPHFLFNSLNSISSLTLTDPPGARDMIVKLSDFMRYSLSSRNDQPVTLHNEMESLRLYLEIEKVRFRERLIIEENIDDECLVALLPGLLLQPLYENAVKHGVYESTGTVVINTSVRKEEDSIIVAISNTVDPDSVVTRKGAGIGLKNVRSRLGLFFGNEANLVVSRNDNSFTVTMNFPFRIAQS